MAVCQFTVPDLCKVVAESLQSEIEERMRAALAPMVNQICRDTARDLVKRVESFHRMPYMDTVVYVQFGDKTAERVA